MGELSCIMCEPSCAYKQTFPIHRVRAKRAFGPHRHRTPETPATATGHTDIRNCGHAGSARS